MSINQSASTYSDQPRVIVAGQPLGDRERLLGAAHWLSVSRAAIRYVFRCERHARKKGGDEVGVTKRGKGVKSILVVDGQGHPIRPAIHSESPAQSKLITKNFGSTVTPKPEGDKPKGRVDRLVVGRGLDSNMLRVNLYENGIHVIRRYQRSRTSLELQDGRELSRYKHTRKVERTFLRVHNFWRLSPC